MAIAYQYNASSFFVEEVEDFGLLPNNATYIKPPFIQVGKWPCWTGKAWKQVEDHRERESYPELVARYGEQYPQKATEYWLPEDDHNSPARTMTSIGPLPDGSLLSPPPINLKFHEIIAETQQPFLDEQENLRKMLVTAQLSNNKDLEEETKLKYQESIRDMNIETSKLLGV